MMENFTRFDEMKAKYRTISDLRKFLIRKGYPSTIMTIRLWERKGLIPAPKRVCFRNIKWRVYTDEEMKTILTMLRSRTKKVVK